jgi:hypothetical protein
MNAADRTRIGRLALSGVVLVGTFVAYACSTTEVNNPGDGGSSGSGGSSGGSSGASSSGGGSSSGSSGSSGGEAGLATTCVSLPSSGLLVDFSNATANDAGGFYFGASTSVGGGTYFYPTYGQQGTPTYYDAGPDGCPNFYCGCDTNLATSTFATGNASPALSFTGNVVTYSGAGTWLYNCVDAHQYKGIQIAASGSTNDIGPDGGANNQLVVMAWELENWGIASVGGTCLAADGGPASNCSPATATVTLPSAGGTVQVPWSSFAGGVPKATIDDPAHIMQVQVQLPWDHCQTGAGYMPNLQISTIGFY